MLTVWGKTVRYSRFLLSILTEIRFFLNWIMSIILPLCSPEILYYNVQFIFWMFNCRRSVHLDTVTPSERSLFSTKTHLKFKSAVIFCSVIPVSTLKVRQNNLLPMSWLFWDKKEQIQVWLRSSLRILYLLTFQTTSSA